MALILAVEPDPRQAAHLASVLRARPRTELVIDGSAVGAIQMLANRVPDVLLTSPLLSRHDETALAVWLRDLGAAAAHVQELTIPILAASAPALEKKRGVLATLRRERSRESRPDGCEPGMFAEQISVYAERASAGRRYEPPPPVDLILLAPTGRDIPEVAESTAEVVPATDELTLPLAFHGTDDLDDDILDDGIALILLPPTEREIARIGDTAWVEVVTRDELTLKFDFDAPVVEEAEPVVEEAEEVWLAIDLDEIAGPLVTAAALPPPSPAPRPPGPPPPAPPPPSPRKIAARPPAKPRAKPPVKPAQDEWGLFDPEQCGFAALLAKLDEITEHKDVHEHRADTTVRVLSY